MDATHRSRQSCLRGQWLALSLATLIVAACGGNDGEAPAAAETTASAHEFKVDPAVHASLLDMGVDADTANYFAAVQVEAVRQEDRDYHYRFSFPDGARRDLKISFEPGSAPASEGGVVVLDSRFARQADDLTFEYRLWVPAGDLPAGLRERLWPQTTGNLLEQLMNGALPVARAQEAAPSGIEVAVIDMIKKASEASISEALEHYESLGPAVKNMKHIFEIASASMDVLAAVDLSIDYRKSETSLDALRACALNPSNFLAQQANDVDPTQALGDAQSDLKEIYTVRYLNLMIGPIAGTNPILGLVMTPALAWSDKGLKQLADNRVRDASSGVTACVGPLRALFVYKFQQGHKLCDDICYNHESSASVNAGFDLEPGPFGNVMISGEPEGTFSVKGGFSLAQGGLNPPYKVSEAREVSVKPTVRLDMDLGDQPAGMSFTDLRELMAAGRKFMTVVAMAEGDYQMTQTGVGNKNNMPTEETTTHNMELKERVSCSFSNIDLSAGGSFSGEVLEWPQWGRVANGDESRGSCTLTLTPKTVSP